MPVRDEERDLGPSVRRLAEYLSSRFPFSARITIADNDSTDGTWAAATALAGELDAVRAVRLDAPGRGRALRSIWAQSDADVLAYMDVDLSTDLYGSHPAPTLAQFRQLISAGEIHYFVGANASSFGGGTGPAAQITAW